MGDFHAQLVFLPSPGGLFLLGGCAVVGGMLTFLQDFKSKNNKMGL